METNYFMTATIERKAHQMLGKLADHRKFHPLRFKPKGSALLIIDMQRYFLDEKSHGFLPSAPAIVPGIKALLEAFRRKNLTTVFTRHLNDQNNAKMMSKWWNDVITEEGGFSEIIKELSTVGSTVIRKTQYDAFYQTTLEDVLKKNGITQIVVTGVMTHLCCESTARSAFVRGFEVIIGIDTTATETEELHLASLTSLAHGFAIPVLGKELIKYLVYD
jgi:isochorismate hydrolase